MIYGLLSESLEQRDIVGQRAGACQHFLGTSLLICCGLLSVWLCPLPQCGFGQHLCAPRHPVCTLGITPTSKPVHSLAELWQWLNYKLTTNLCHCHCLGVAWRSGT